MLAVCVLVGVVVWEKTDSYPCRMLIVVMMGKWSDNSAFWGVHDVRLYSVLDTVVISGEDVFVVCCLTLWLVCLCLVLCGQS